MRKKMIIIFTVALSLISFSPVFSEEKRIEGEIKAAGVLTDINGSKAKFNEYRDLKDGIYGKIRLKYDNDNYFMKLNAYDIGYDTQSYKLDGGMWGKFKYNLKYNEIPHNFTLGAKTFYSGAGTNNLTFNGTTAPFTAVANSVDTPSVVNQFANFFDYSIKRKQYGGGFKLEMLKPLYLDFALFREERGGIVPVAAARGTGSGNGMVELPAPVDYVTNNFKAEVGYAKNPVFASLSFLYSKFDNDNENLYFRFPNTAAGGATDQDVYTLPPDNDYYKLAFKGKVKLPLNSALNVNAGKSRAKSKANVLNYYLTGTTTATRTSITGLTDTDFNGKVDTTSYGFVLNSNPVSYLDGKIYYKYYDKANNSDQITGTVGATNYTNKLFEYRKNMFGVEAGIKLPAKFTVTPFYKYAKTNRERDDIPETKDNVYGIDVKWNGVEFMTAKAGYEKLEREAMWMLASYGIAIDGAPQTRDTYKIGMDVYPVDGLNIGLEYKNKKSKYEDTGRGFREDKNNEYSVNADYAVGKLMTIAGYYDYEDRKTKQLQNGTGATVRWEVAQKDKSNDYGISTDVHVIPRKITLRAQYDYVRSNGFVDINYLTAVPAGYTQDTLDLSNWDDYRKESVMAKAIYNVSKSLSLAAGYAYEKFKYNDAAINGYAYYYSTASTNPSYFTGAYSAPSYSANVIFAAVTYKF